MRHTLENDAPAARFADCYLLGNGALGAAVHGRVGAERFDLNFDTLWSGGLAARVPRRDPGGVTALRAAGAAGPGHCSRRRGCRRSSRSADRGGVRPGAAERRPPLGDRRRLDLRSGLASSSHGAGVELKT
ncbi:glycoside hydrolase N-terminal domain-containing protein [Xylanimonas sp. McL0601]|uniref:glycoside hydrolase N-terminal domain-containing protein n=1 Tax=Xylanimonas sp. McL0601 TaxID=3414739 RepID=UPI003CF90DFF